MVSSQEDVEAFDRLQEKSFDPHRLALSSPAMDGLEVYRFRKGFILITIYSI